MKTQTFGIGSMCDIQPTRQANAWSRASNDARLAYKENRYNGEHKSPEYEKWNPWGGRVEWTKGTVEEDLVYGEKIEITEADVGTGTNAFYYEYECKYCESGNDQTRMAKRDQEYLGGLLAGNILKEKEYKVWCLWQIDGAPEDIGKWWVENYCNKSPYVDKKLAGAEEAYEQFIANKERTILPVNRVT